MEQTKELSEGPLTIWRLSWPIGIELTLQLLMGTIDTLMVSRLGDRAVSAVGISNQVVTAAMTLFALINAGVAIVLARNWGAGNYEKARKAAILSMQANGLAGIALSLFFALFTGVTLAALSTPQEISPYANEYLTTIGGCFVVVVLHAATNTVIRSTGNTKGPMYIAVGMNVVHLLLNGLLIFGHAGFPEMGIAGAAYSTAISRSLALLVSAWLLWKTFHPAWARKEWFVLDKSVLKEVAKIGLPVSFTAVSWGFSQVFITRIVSGMGPDAIGAYAYLQTIQMWPWIAASAIAGGLGILVSQLYGAGKTEELTKRLRRGITAGMAIVTTVSAILFAAGHPVMALFTSSREIVDLAIPVLGFTIIWMPLRVVGLLTSTSLNAVGEARAVGLMSIFGMWALATGGAYLLGDLAGIGLMGVFLAALADEIVRASYFVARWRKKSKQLRAVSDSIPIQA
ncbi:MATE family efflux transporter [Cohnella suwonensis]|uniref:MATE family efflux transporter n=1 Tax=Cohnella suwonensis TaxID=696072 RepID=A0ABW0M0P9_9BACL